MREPELPADFTDKVLAKISNYESRAESRSQKISNFDLSVEQAAVVGLFSGEDRDGWLMRELKRRYYYRVELNWMGELIKEVFDKSYNLGSILYNEFENLGLKLRDNRIIRHLSREEGIKLICGVVENFPINDESRKRIAHDIWTQYSQGRVPNFAAA